MKRSLLAAALLVATATTALASSANDMVTLRTAGYWTSYYDPSNSGGKPMCGMMSKIDYDSGAFGGIMVKYESGGSGSMFVHAFKSSWRIPDGTEIPVSLQFDRSEPLSATALGGPSATGPGSFVTIPIRNDFTASFLTQFANASSMILGFREGSEGSWPVKMSGSREVVESFSKCVVALGQTPGTTQPFGNKAAPSATQPFGGTPKQPPQPFANGKGGV